MEVAGSQGGSTSAASRDTEHMPGYAPTLIHVSHVHVYSTVSHRILLLEHLAWNPRDDILIHTPAQLFRLS